MVLPVMMWIAWSLFPSYLFAVQAISAATIPEANIIYDAKVSAQMSRPVVFERKVLEA